MSNFSHHGSEKKVYVEKMFNDISKRYDFFNTVSSFGLDRYWRSKLTSKFNLNKSHRLLDVATGTGDVIFSMYKKFKVMSYGIDIADKMDFEENSFDALTISFGFRNLGNYETGLIEFFRVLNRGGKIAILEFSTPTSRWFSPLFKFYFKNVVPLVGAMLARKDAFLYLPESVDHFLKRDEVCSKMKEVGFKDVNFKDYTFGVVTIYTGFKK